MSGIKTLFSTFYTSFLFPHHTMLTMSHLFTMVKCKFYFIFFYLYTSDYTVKLNKKRDSQNQWWSLTFKVLLCDVIEVENENKVKNFNFVWLEFNGIEMILSLKKKRKSFILQLDLDDNLITNSTILWWAWTKKNQPQTLDIIVFYACLK